MKSHRVALALPTAGVLVLGAALAGCSPGLFWSDEMCTLIGCASGPAVALPDISSEAFEATVATDVASGSFQCDGPRTPDGGSFPTEPANLTGDFAGADPPILVACTPEGFRLVQNRGTAPVQRVSVEAEGLSSGTAVAQVFEDIQYEVSQPNGPDCEPTCHNAVLTVSAE